MDDPFDPIKKFTLEQNEEMFRRCGAASMSLHQTYPDDAQIAFDSQANNMHKQDPAQYKAIYEPFNDQSHELRDVESEVDAGEKTVGI